MCVVLHIFHIEKKITNFFVKLGGQDRPWAFCVFISTVSFTTCSTWVTNFRPHLQDILENSPDPG